MWRQDWKKRLEPYVESGYVSAQRHPTLPLTIYDYTSKCVYDAKWDDVTLRTRGLVVDDRGQCVNAPLKKFFNLEEPLGQELADRKANDGYLIQEKLDGSCIFVTLYRHMPTLRERLRGHRSSREVLVHTRGSFTSRQALDASRWLLEHHGSDWLLDGFTYVFEWLSPSNRIVVNYGDREELVLLARVQHGNFQSTFFAPEWKGQHIGFNRIGRGRATLDTLKQSIDDNAEGYVIVFFNGERLKIKGDAYLEKHRTMSGLSTMIVWEKSQTDETWNAFLPTLDEESREWAIAKRDAMFNERFRLHRKALTYLTAITDLSPTEAELATRITQDISDPQMRGLVFAVLRNNAKAIDNILWKMVKPKNKQERFSGGLNQLG